MGNILSDGNNKDPEFYVVIAVSVLFSIIFSYYSILRYYSIDATGFDLGIYSSALFNAMRGSLFYTNLLNGSFLGNHFSPFMFLLLAIFWLYPHNTTILVLQGFALGLAGIPAYLIFSHFLKDSEYPDISILLVMLFEVSPILIGPISFDFHLMAFLPLFYLFAFYYFLRRSIYKAILFTALSISLHAFFAAIIILMLIAIYLQRFWPVSNKTSEPHEFISLKFLIISSVMIIAYFIIAEHLKGMISGSSIDLTSLASLLNYVHQQYNIVFSEGMLFNYSGIKIFLIILMLIAGGIFSLRYPILLIPIIPYILFAFFSMNTAYFTIGYQYTAMISPIILSAAAIGLYKILEKKYRTYRYDQIRRFAVLTLILILIAINFTYSPVSPEPMHINTGNIASISYFKINETSEIVFALRATINDSSYILLQNNLYPQFFNFRHAYLLYSYNRVGNLSDLIRQNFTFIIGDTYNGFYLQNTVVGISMSSLISYELDHGYGTFLNQDGIIVIEHGYNGNPHYFNGKSIVS
ncbi:MAG: DUF2079 domain-containing protein [Thermoplasma acidophilum]|nr:DUF2079 domain-containing protein [Thermoplasma acidophilum]